MKSVCFTIISGKIIDKFWLKILLATTPVSNLLPTIGLKDCFPFEASYHSLQNLYHLFILNLKVYIRIYMAKRKAKSAKLQLMKEKKKLVRYDGHIIYRIYLLDEKEKFLYQKLKNF